MLSPRGRGLPTEPQEHSVPSRTGCGSTRWERERKGGLGGGPVSERPSVGEALGEGQCQDGHRDGGDVGSPSRHHVLVLWNCQGQGMSPGHRPPYHFPSLPLPPAKGPPCLGEELRRGVESAEGQAQVRRALEAGAATQAPCPGALPPRRRSAKGQEQAHLPQCAGCPCRAGPARASELGLSPGESAPSRACACATLPPCPGSSRGSTHRQGGDAIYRLTASFSGIPEPARWRCRLPQLTPRMAFPPTPRRLRGLSHRISWGCDFWFLWQLGKTCNCGFLESKMRAEV